MSEIELCRELWLWAKDDIVPSDLQGLCKQSAKKLKQLQAGIDRMATQIDEQNKEKKRLKECLEEISLENDSIFPGMQHCKICGARDVGVMGHTLNCKYEQALKDKL